MAKGKKAKSPSEKSVQAVRSNKNKAKRIEKELQKNPNNTKARTKLEQLQTKK